MKTASATMATTKIPKTTKKAAFVATVGVTNASAITRQGRGAVTSPGHTAPMVLVAPRPSRQAAHAAAARAPAGGSEVLSLLRGGAAARPRFDPGLAGG